MFSEFWVESIVGKTGSSLLLTKVYPVIEWKAVLGDLYGSSELWFYGSMNLLIGE